MITYIWEPLNGMSVTLQNQYYYFLFVKQRKKREPVRHQVPSFILFAKVNDIGIRTCHMITKHVSFVQIFKFAIQAICNDF